MTDYAFPLRSASEFVGRVHEAPADAHVRRWVLRDDNLRHYHGVVSLADDPLYLELHWKRDSRSKEQRVGLFLLHVRRLMEEGYVRPEGDEAVRLRFYRGERGVIYIQTRHDEPALEIGVVDVSLD